MTEHIRALLREIYGNRVGDETAERLAGLLSRYRASIERPSSFGGEISEEGLPLDETDSLVITYGDQFRGPEKSPLGYLLDFLDEDLDAAVGGVHILPFFPYSSDDGFSIVDYRTVNPEMGSWEDIEAIAEEFRLMADLVLNHCSKESDWFKAFKNGEEPYARYFIAVEPGTDLTSVVRPRALPLTHEYETADGTKHVWTTFSEDQVDLNFAEPTVLLEMLDVFLGYIARGVQIVRLDAIAYLWKEIGTPSIHHPKTHAVVKLFRALVEEVARWVVIITETNVPHEENISYFGTDGDEAHMVYQFSLPPLVLDAFLRENVDHLCQWAKTLPAVRQGTTFFNFLASHDGIGLLPAKGLLSEQEIERLIASVQDRGGLISYKATPEGDIPYEMNINYLEAIAEATLPDDQRARKFLTSQAIMLAMAGVPGIYVHSLIGSTNWTEGVKQTGHNRTINRQKLDYETVVAELQDEGTLRNLVFTGYKHLLEIRATEAAFHPAAEQHIVDAGPSVFAILRVTAERDEELLEDDEEESGRILCLHNVSHELAECTIDRQLIELGDSRVLENLVEGETIYPHDEGGGRISIELEPYEVMWLKW